MRSALDRRWLLAASGLLFVVSQGAILFVVAPIGGELLELQCLGFSAERTLAIYREWERSGAMSAYRAHFTLDAVHWVWYSVFATCLLCRQFERHRVDPRFDWILIAPLVSGLLDALENGIQQHFLHSPDFAAITDPLALLGTLASWGKWLLVAGYVSLALLLIVRRPSRDCRTG
ncbi:MAG: hypothetical protein ACQGVK_11880 [Myxococcota bacterium]